MSARTAAGHRRGGGQTARLGGLTCSEPLLDERQPVAGAQQLDVAARQRAALAGELDGELRRPAGAFRHLEATQKGADPCGGHRRGCSPWTIRRQGNDGRGLTSVFGAMGEAGDPPLYRLLLRVPGTVKRFCVREAANVHATKNTVNSGL